MRQVARVSLLLAVLAASSSRCWAQTELIDGSLASDITFGRGYDPTIATLFPQAVAIAGNEDLAIGGGPSSDLVIEIADNKTELRSKLNMSVAASAGIGLFKGSASASRATVQSSTLRSVYVIVTAYAYLAPEIKKATDLLPEARATFVTQGEAAFYKAYGTHFIRGVRRGKMLQAVLTISTEDESKFETMKADVHAKYGALKVSADVATETQAISSNYAVSAKIVRRGLVDPFPGMSVQDFVAYAEKFGSIDVNDPNAAAVEIIAVPYRSVFPSFGPEKRDRRTGVLQIYSDYLDDAYARLLLLSDVMANASLYEPGVRTAAKSALVEVKEAIEKANEQVEVLATISVGEPVSVDELPDLPSVPALSNFGFRPPPDLAGSLLRPSLDVVLSGVDGQNSGDASIKPGSGPDFRWSIDVKQGTNLGTRVELPALTYLSNTAKRAAVIKAEYPGKALIYAVTPAGESLGCGDIFFHSRRDGSYYRARPQMLGESDRVWFWVQSRGAVEPDESTFSKCK